MFAVPAVVAAVQPQCRGVGFLVVQTSTANMFFLIYFAHKFSQE